MPYDSNRHGPPPYRSDRGPSDAGVRDLLIFLRDTFRDAAARIDRYLGDGDRYADRGGYRDRDRDRYEDRGPRGGGNDWGHDRGGPPPVRRGPPPPSASADAPPPGNALDVGTRVPLESLREEARQISQDAPDLDPAELRLKVEAVTAETRALQNRAEDPEDRDIAAKILRALTAIVSEHRPGHVYGLARHHQADWDEVARRARQELSSGAFRERPAGRE